jgi:hypothetical protein
MRRRLVEQGFGADRFFRRYGLADGLTTTLTGVLLSLIVPVQVVNGRLMRTRIRQAVSSSPQP